MTEKQTTPEDDPVQREAIRRAKLRITPKGRAVVGAAGVVLAAGVVFGAHKVIDAAENYNDNHLEETTYSAEDLNRMLNPTISELELAPEVAIRTDGMLVHTDTNELTPDANLILDYDSGGEQTTVQTPSGVYVRQDNNGTWYGFSSSLLPANLHETTPQARLNIDKDGIVWVNSQDASPIFSVVGDVATDPSTLPESPASPTDLPSNLTDQNS